MSKLWKRAWSLVATAACASILTTDLCAQTACQSTPGPDVIVGDITGPQDYSVNGAFDALSLGTYSCNMGTAPLNWHANTNQHPVIGGELYRYKVVDGAGRFEMIGRSWLKHGFFALSNNLCCSGCQGTDGSQLGVRCADPYTASRNGSQSGLGPRNTVNAHTGFFPYPPPHPAGGNLGRLEVDLNDLEPSSPTGTRYFGQCQYVAPDDSSINNDNNNCSYREVTAADLGGTQRFDFAFNGSTQRELPAIRAWQACETGVTVTNVQIPGEGLLMLGSKVTNISPGVYRYEYALFNMNSDASVRSFSVPVAGTNLTKVGFHDVAYRSDGSYSTADWGTSIAAGSHVWSTSTFAQDPNANAIRWASTYNFRFDADRAPQNGTISIGLFKTGGTVTTSGPVPGEPVPGSVFCPGDDTLQTFCPCNNDNGGNPNTGCANSQNSNGAGMTSAGTVSPDTVVLTATGELPSALSIILQSNIPAHNGIVFGDGLRCLQGNLKRMYTKNAVAGVVSAPTGADPSITTRSAALGDPLGTGSTRYYQSWYRDPNPAYCPAPVGNTFNASSGQIITW